ncbi:hypothetical protein [Agromyces humi]|uniref:hypothetical protein n=1 Tax=Agromyces humi TaxID=1766800 RepID=UPI00135A1515|nr:hypothetical protein [Agromyces humi]
MTTTFNESTVLRAGAGPNPGWFAGHTPSPAETVLELSLADEDTANLDRVAEIAARFDAATATERDDLYRLINAINTNGRMRVRDQALTGIRRLAAVSRNHAAADAARALHEDRQLAAAAGAVGAAELQKRTFALLAASDAAEALAARPHIGRAPGFNQAAYDHLTYPWRAVFGPIHPADDARPFTWGAYPAV